jgi:aldose 1-epimerase
LDGREVVLPVNNHPAGMGCHLHGGFAGFNQRVWSAEPLHRPDAAGVRFSRRSPDGEEGYPGNLEVEVTYWLTNAREWRIEYACVADQATPVNFTQHTAFNLAGEGAGDILGHELHIRATHFTPVTPGLIPTGEITPVAGSPFDFTSPRLIGERIHEPHPQLERGRGYDHNWVLDAGGGALAEAATLHDPASGRVMDVLTTEPGLQVYTGNFLDGSRLGTSGRPHDFRTGLCLETQHFPDAPNHPNFPSVILRPGVRRTSTTVYRFGTLAHSCDR